MTAPTPDTLVLEHLHLLPAIARRLGVKPSAVADYEDYLQAGATGLVLAARAYTPAHVASFTTFAWACAAHEMLAEARTATWQRQARSRPDRTLHSLDATPDSLADANAPDPAEATVRAQTNATVRAAVDALPPVLRTVVRAYWFDGQQQKDIAARLGISPTRVSQHLQRAYRLLAQALRDHTDVTQPTPEEVAA